MKSKLKYLEIGHREYVVKLQDTVIGYINGAVHDGLKFHFEKDYHFGNIQDSFNEISDFIEGIEPIVIKNNQIKSDANICIDGEDEKEFLVTFKSGKELILDFDQTQLILDAIESKNNNPVMFKDIIGKSIGFINISEIAFINPKY